MDLAHEFDVSVPIEHAWEMFNDLSRVIPSLPGAGLDGVDGDITLGNVKVKVGPVTASYKGKAWFLEQDETAKKVVVRAEGRDTRGQGNAKATITIRLAQRAAGTHADVQIDMAITGRVAQIGRGLIADVSAKLMGQFVDNLEAELIAGEVANDALVEAELSRPRSQAESTEFALPLAEQNESQPVDLLATAGAPLARRLAPVALGVAVAAVLYWLIAG
jgi:carbon monoxide dehydrogenase subunit G